MVANSLKFVLLLIAITLKGPWAMALENDIWFYCGTYTTKLGHVEGQAETIGIYSLNSDSGAIRYVGSSPKIANSSHLCLGHQQKFLYSISEITEYKGERDGCLTVFAIDPVTKELSKVQTISSHGPGPAYVSLDQTGRFLLSANYVAGNVVIFPIQSDGILGAPTANAMHSGSSLDSQRQTRPHPHAILTSLDNRYLFVPDLGVDRIVAYAFDAGTGALNPQSNLDVITPAGSGPRHLVFAPSGKWAFLSLELSSEVAAYAYSKGRLKEVGRYSTLPVSFGGTNHCAEVRVSPDENNVYVSNRGHDSLAVFTLNEKSGALELAQTVSTEGKTPRNFDISPDGEWVVAANQDSHALVSYRRDPLTGKLHPTDVRVDSPSPALICFLR